MQLDKVPVIAPDRQPANGRYFTWEDDALNVKMRAEEKYHSGPLLPRQDDPRRCKGFSRAHMRPCRKWAIKNIEGKYLTFCADHMQTTKVHGGHGGALMTANAIVARATKATRHGAYSEILRLQIAEGLKANPEGKSRSTLENILEVMNGVDTDDLSGPLNGALQLTMGVTASLVNRHSRGEITFEDFLTGVAVLTEMLRKLAIAKHDIVGSADDEKERAIQRALDEQGLTGEEDNNGNVWGEDEGLWQSEPSGNERGEDAGSEGRRDSA